MADKVCLVTGVGPGTGAALARRFAEGYAVAMLARNAERLAELEAEIPAARAYPCDVSDAAELAAVRPLAFGPEGSVEMAERFGALHRLSMGIYLVVSAAALGLLCLHARADARAADCWCR